MTYTFSRKAEDDLVGIYIEGVSLFGEKQADEYHYEIEKMVDLLSKSPRIARERLEISPPIRIHPFRSHLIVYIVDDNDDIFIVRIRHRHEDWQGDSF
ncbi:type II toxin-antitoxin system RelE/ParE family toxin [Mariprofundus sp. EBB-1]|uniref:type II toxin-antitoxin system RelE/ParE family toxin n=1 Tax=Mariprofundus sp. EBB-1 TaxID=2650971 RepID=UPI000EF28193|nr:type II toxin-antitoxin system RelE/ParE family toxin [Mariprofundus sp. EBB-1]RLL49694.1 type II toxin-antitoxin system RelE/ParE family toxin [Mariprofundus sp. EBB-1]